MYNLDLSCLLQPIIKTIFAAPRRPARRPRPAPVHRLPAHRLPAHRLPAHRLPALVHQQPAHRRHQQQQRLLPGRLIGSQSILANIELDYIVFFKCTG